MIITRPGAHRSTSSAGHASPPITKAVDSKPLSDNAVTAEGVWVNTLTRSLTSNAWKSSTERVTDPGTTTSRPPCNSAPQISHTEKSNAYEWNCVHTCPGDSAWPTWSESKSCVTLCWVTATPLGTPVVPDV
ncbi:hypothetical protein MSIMFI_05312 [Mycobacterium simulans]|nr:hypothetical protein MSIMFI_05312 [Mycobacterium simulans]